MASAIKSKAAKTLMAIVIAVTIIAMMPLTANAHCDTMDGPTVADGRKAMESNNINYVLKWVQPEYDEEVTLIFNQSMKIKDLSSEAKEVAEQYFFGNLVRIHRAGEGAPYTGLKPSGTHVDEKVLAADKSIEIGNLSPLENLIEKEKMPELTERFDKVMSLKNYDVNDVEAGREYIEAYVKFFKFAEGEEDAHGASDVHATNAEADAHEAEKEKGISNINWIPWALAGLFFVTTVVSHVKLFKSMKK